FQTATLVTGIDSFKRFEIPHNFFRAKVMRKKEEKKTEVTECLHLYVPYEIDSRKIRTFAK
ncbi:hypothetical protein, partial [Bacteroides bouchesdurhonensis]